MLNLRESIAKPTGARKASSRVSERQVVIFAVRGSGRGMS